MKTYSGKIFGLKPNQIFVFGSNTQGKHGMGGAWFAVSFCGAIYGQAKGRQGQSYAIVTKDLTTKIHPSVTKESIIEQIIELYTYAYTHPALEFLVAYNGEGKNLNAFLPQEMADMFNQKPIPENIVFEEKFYKLML